MNNSNLALKEWGKSVAANVVLFPRKKEEKKEQCEIVVDQESQSKKNMDLIMKMIDYRMAGITDIEKMGFVAGVCKGQIIGYAAAGSITESQAEQLTNYLYTKWEIMRTINNTK